MVKCRLSSGSGWCDFVTDLGNFVFYINIRMGIIEYPKVTHGEEDYVRDGVRGLMGDLYHG